MENISTFPANDSHIKVLIVDDHPNTANMLARAISRLGSHVEVVSATSGPEALQHVEDGAVDILITDMMMPEMTGMELIEILNSKPALAPGAIFLLTAHDSAGVREIAQRLHVKDVIAKPAHPEHICQLITQTMAELKQSRLANPAPDFSQAHMPNPDVEPKQEELNISQLLEEVAQKFQTQTDGHQQVLVVGKTEAYSKVYGNAAQVRQALRHLIWGAIKNTPKGGTVILSSENESGMVRVFIRDTGYGVPSAVLPEALHDQDLEIVKAIAEQHGGSVTVESELGKGSCFTLSLPLISNGNQMIQVMETHSTTQVK